jgi:VIT1/CCC1 family predicted Fe2+/Mn2+ transporter
LYQLFKQNNITINTGHIDLAKAKLSLKDVLKNSLNRSHAKGYFISGLILLFTSLIVPFKLYYIIISSTLFTLSLLCMFKPTTKSSKSLFD